MNILWWRELPKVETRFVVVPISDQDQYLYVFETARSVGYQWKPGCGVGWVNGSTGYLDNKIVFDSHNKGIYRDTWQKNVTVLRLKDAVRFLQKQKA